MYCPGCGTEQVEGARFCVNCGRDMGYHMSATETEYAGFWRRFAAYIIDAVLINAAQLVIGLILGIALMYIIGIIGMVLYFTLMESSSKQATLGKMALGIIVTDNNGGRISFGQALGRYLAKIISTLILLIGFIMIAFTGKKQGLHDIIAGTLVVLR